MRLFDNYSDHLRAVVAATAAPHGFTLTIWTSAAIAGHAAGAPDDFEAILFLVGALAGFSFVGTAVYGRIDALLSTDRPHEVRLWGALHFPAIGVTVVETVAITKFVTGAAVFPIASFTATSTYLAISAMQFTLAGARRPERPSRSTEESSMP
ncbi:MAG: hypothetical protein ACRDPE_15920 [Solirubrobacterales bacterium]